jgi:hypothetical protein
MDARRCLDAMKPADMEVGLQTRPELSRCHAPVQSADINLRLQVRPELARCHADVLVDIDFCRLIRPELQTGPLPSTMFVCYSDLSSREFVCRMLFLRRQSHAKSAVFARRVLHVQSGQRCEFL